MEDTQSRRGWLAPGTLQQQRTLMLHHSLQPLPHPHTGLTPRALQARGRQTTAHWPNPACCLCLYMKSHQYAAWHTHVRGVYSYSGRGEPWPTKPKQFSVWPRKECTDPCTSFLSSWPVPPALRGRPPSFPDAPRGGGLRCPQQTATAWENPFRIFSAPQIPAVPTTHFATWGNLSASPSFCFGALQ